MTTKIRTTTARMLAVLDPETPTEASYDPAFTPVEGMREPDFAEGDRAYWIGADATISCWIEDAPEIADVLTRAGWMARTGSHPLLLDLSVEPHNPEVPEGPLMRNGVLYTLWTMARDTVLVES